LGLVLSGGRERIYTFGFRLAPSFREKGNSLAQMGRALAMIGWNDMENLAQMPTPPYSVCGRENH